MTTQKTLNNKKIRTPRPGTFFNRKKNLRKKDIFFLKKKSFKENGN